MPLPATPAGCLIQHINRPFLTGGVPTGADAAPGHATGFSSSSPPLNPMTSTDNSPNVPGGDNQNHPRNRIDVNPPYGSTFPERVAHFRELLAKLIARQILAERLAPKDFDNKTDS